MKLTLWCGLAALLLSAASSLFAGLDEMRIAELDVATDRLEMYHDSSSSYTLTANEELWICINGNYQRVADGGETVGTAANPRTVNLTLSISTGANDIWIYKSTTGGSPNFTSSSLIVHGLRYGGSGGVRTPVAVTAGIWTSSSDFVQAPGASQSIVWDGSGFTKDDWYHDDSPSIGSANTTTIGSVASSLNWSSSTQNFESVGDGDLVTAISNWVIVNDSSESDFSVRGTSHAPSTSGTRPSGTTGWLKIVDDDETNVQNRFYSGTIDAGQPAPSAYRWTWYVLVEQAPSSSATNFPRLTIQHDDGTTAMANAFGIEIRNNSFHLVRLGLGGSTQTSSIGSYSTNTWYRLDLAVDFTNSQIQGRVDAGSATTMAINFDGGADQSRFRFCYRGEGADNGTTLYLDDVSLTNDYPADPTITSTAGTSVFESQAYSYTITTAGAPTPTISVAGLPSWLSFDNVDTVSGTPGSSDVGNHSFTVTATNGFGTNASQNVDVTVNSSDAPAITSSAPTTADPGFLYSYTFSASGNPAPTVSVSGLPGWLNFDNVDTISGTPTTNDIGPTGVITITATNGVSPDAVQSFEIDVRQPVAPSITTTAPSGTIFTTAAFSYTFAFTGTPEPSVQVTGMPSWMSFDNIDTISGTPNTGQTGNVNVTIDVSNGVAPDATQTIDLTVEDPVPPTVTSSPVTMGVFVGDSYSYVIVVTGNPTPTITVSGLPGWLNFDDVDTISGTPLASDTGPTGTIIVTASNGFGANSVQDFTVLVEAEMAPMFTSTPPTTAAVGTPYSYTLTAAANPSATFSVANLPAWLSFDGTDTISGTPQASDSGPSNMITVTATNGIDPDATQDFQITVDNPVAPTITSSASTTATAGTQYTYTVVATGNPIPTISVSGLPSWLSFDGSDTLTGTPARTDQGTSGVIVISASNGVLPTDAESFSIDVSAEPLITSTEVTQVDVGQTYSYQVVVNGTPAPTISVSGLPAWLNFDGTDTITGTPALTDVGPSGTITVTATNGIGNNSEQQFTVTVIDPNAPPLEQTVGTAGATLNGPIGTPVEGVVITIPAGALASAVSITAADGNTIVPTTNQDAVGDAIELGPDGQTFASAVTVTIPFNPANLTGGLTINDLVVLKLETGGAITELTPVSVDAAANTLTVEVTSFSTFQVFTSTPASTPPASGGGGGGCSLAATGMQGLWLLVLLLLAALVSTRPGRQRE